MSIYLYITIVLDLLFEIDLDRDLSEIVFRLVLLFNSNCDICYLSNATCN